MIGSSYLEDGRAGRPSSGLVDLRSSLREKVLRTGSFRYDASSRGPF